MIVRLAQHNSLGFTLSSERRIYIYIYKKCEYSHFTLLLIQTVASTVRMLPLHATSDPDSGMERWETEWRSRRRRGGGVKEARVAERQEAGWWSEGGESGGAAGPGMVDIGSWSCGGDKQHSAGAGRQIAGVRVEELQRTIPFPAFRRIALTHSRCEVALFSDFSCRSIAPSSSSWAFVTTSLSGCLSGPNDFHRGCALVLRKDGAWAVAQSHATPSGQLWLDAEASQGMGRNGSTPAGFTGRIKARFFTASGSIIWTPVAIRLGCR